VGGDGGAASLQKIAARSITPGRFKLPFRAREPERDIRAEGASMTADVLTAPTDTPEADCAWPPTMLDREPETCWCLPHSAELPCPACALLRQAPFAKGQP
jgi:hypothetical protein